MPISHKTSVRLLFVFSVFVLVACNSSGSSNPQVDTTESENNPQSGNETINNSSNTIAVVNGFVLVQEEVTDGQGFILVRYDYELDEASKTINGIRYDLQGDIITESFLIELTYNEKGHPGSQTLSRSRSGELVLSHTYDYNEQGQLITVTSNHTEQPQNDRVELFGYDPSGNLISHEENYTDNNNPYSSTEFTLREDGQPATKEHNDYSLTDASKTLSTYQYDSDNRLIGRFDAVFRHEYAYDSDGNIGTITVYNQDGALHMTHEYSYAAASVQVYNKINWETVYYPR